MKERVRRKRCICSILVVLMVFLASISWGKRETHTVVLEKANKSNDPFVRLITFRITRPGTVKVYGKVKRGKKKLVAISLFSIEGNKRKFLAKGSRKKGRETIRLEFSVDDLMLMKTKKFAVGVANFDTRRKATVEMVISYPVAGEEESEAKPIYPDLSIRNVSLSPECFVEVTVANEGPGRLAGVFWEKNSPTLKIYKNGRFWGGAALKIIDPGKKLSRKGGAVVYRSRMKVSGTTLVKAQMDMGPKARDENLGNNVMERSLKCLGPPDLTIEKISLSRDCRVVVTVRNLGGPIPQSVWNSRPGPNIYLYVNGRGWGGTALRVIDPRRKLTRPRGRVTYGSNLRVRGEARIRAVVDSNQVVTEKDETNNGLEVLLSCQ